jgi:hypothetical protein
MNKVNETNAMEQEPSSGSHYVCENFVRESDVIVVLEEYNHESDTSVISWADEYDENSSSDSDTEKDVALQTSRSQTKTVTGDLKWVSTLKYSQPQKFLHSVGPFHDLPPSSAEKDYLSLFLDQEFYEWVAQQTNKYASYCQKDMPDSKWEETNGREIQAYIGILIYMGLVELPEMCDYFQGDFVVCPIVRQAMTLRRFEKLGQYLRLSDEENIPRKNDKHYDPLYKVRPALDIMNKFKNVYRPGRDLAVDEAMIGFKGRFCLKQCMAGRLNRWGIKAWGIADSINGYLLKCKICLRKEEKRNESLLLGEQIVLEMCEDYTGKYHHVYFDKFFSSAKLMKMLLEKQIYACGTTQAGRKDWPAEFRNPKSLKLKRGESRKLQHEDVTAVVWHDNQDVLILSTNSNPETDVMVTRRSGKDREKIAIACPEAVVNYTKSMGGVDVADQKREYYGIGRASKTWWKYVFHFVLNVAIVNSFILYDLTNRPVQISHGNRQLQYRINLVTQLIGDFTSRKRVGRKRSLPCGTPLPKTLHCLEKISGRVKTCAECMVKKRKTPSGRGIQTAYKCRQCDLPLCRVGCFLSYHQQRDVEVENSGMDMNCK